MTRLWLRVVDRLPQRVAALCGADDTAAALQLLRQLHWLRSLAAAKILRTPPTS